LQSKDEQLQNKDEQLNRMLAVRKLQEASQQHVAVSEQFVQQIEEEGLISRLLEQKIKKLLSTVRGSRQERINPDQLLLFSTHELEQIAAVTRSFQATWKKDPLSESDGAQEPADCKAKRRKLPAAYAEGSSTVRAF
jgi:hypothetical protein